MRLLARITLPMIVVALLGGLMTAFGQAAQDPSPNTQPSGNPDVSEQLRLTPDQIQKIRQIQRETKDERAAINLRLRQSNRALQDVLDAETLDENLLEQRMQDVAAAQNAQMRMRIQTEVRIRRILNPSQLARWRELRLQAGDVIRAQDGRPRPNQRGFEGLRPNQRNGIAPLFPRRNQAIRNPRP
jgi:Spy/CpxP family protein refolding chaperone